MTPIAIEMAAKLLMVPNDADMREAEANLRSLLAEATQRFTFPDPSKPWPKDFRTTVDTALASAEELIRSTR